MEYSDSSVRKAARRTGRLAVLLGLAFALVLAGAAGADPRVDSFSGSCSVQGTVHFTPPATNTQQMLDATYDAIGTCSGILNGRSVSDAPVSVYQAVHAIDGSCMHASTTEPGYGAMTFADGTTIRYSFEFDFVLTEGTFTFQGQRSGSAHGTGTFLTQRTPPDLALQCGGNGVSDAPMDVSLTTDSPLVSKHAGGRR
jgi:hypothetical protein